ncbi:MAG: NlpC/P60 family protein [Actinomycetes bacterium]
MTHRTLRAGLMAALLAGVLATGVVPLAAQADPGELGPARDRAAALRTEVADLRVQAEAATEDYNSIRTQLAKAMSAQVLAERSQAQAEAAGQQAEDQLASRARSLYMSGGHLALYASVLDGQTLGDVFTRVEGVRAVIQSDSRTVGHHRSAVAAASQESDRLALLTDRRTRLEHKSAGTADRVRALLARQKTLLENADDEVRRLAEEQDRREAAAAARRAAEAAAAARRAAAAAVPPPTDLSGSVTGKPGTSAAATAIAEALRMQGRPYEWGAVGPDTFDCSGLTGWAYRHAGITLPRTSREQWYAGRRVALADLAPGDLLFWATNTSDPGSIHHVAMYLGGGQMIHAPHTGDVVRVAAMYLDGYIGAVRPAA